MIDAVEKFLRTVQDASQDYKRERDYGAKTGITTQAVIEEVNTRFREHGVGFQYESGEILRVDLQVIHKEVTIPALKFLSGPAFSGANEEFLSAYEHYRHNNYKEAIVDALKSFESR